MQKEAISICLASDENYSKYMGITIYSILKNAAESDNLAFYILDNKISAASKSKIESLKETKNFSITWIDVNPDNFKNCSVTQKGLTLTAYARFLIPDKIPAAKVLYLDCDILVRTSLAPLFNIDISDKLVGGVIDIGVGEKYYKKHLGARVNHYLNSGVLLINNDLWRKYSIREWLFDYAAENSASLKYNDQDAINYVCAGRKLILPYEWNVMDSFYYPDIASNHADAAELKRAAENPKIRHCKPFKQNYFKPHKQEYRKLMAESPWSADIPCDDAGVKLWCSLVLYYMKLRPLFVFSRKFWLRVRAIGFKGTLCDK